MAAQITLETWVLGVHIHFYVCMYVLYEWLVNLLVLYLIFECFACVYVCALCVSLVP